jgi:hypothetical protein
MNPLRLIARLAAIALLIFFVRDFWVTQTHSERTPGWDARAVCSGNDAYRKDLNPYYVTNLVGTDLSYTYPPLTFELFKPLCTAPLDIRESFKYLYPLLLVFLIALFGAKDLAHGLYDRALIKTLFLTGGFAGFHWVYLTGNIAAIECALLASGIFCFAPTGKSAPNELTLRYLLGAVLLGFSCFLKVINFPIILALYFVPLDRPQKLKLIGTGLLAYAIPMGLSIFAFHDLFGTFVHAISGKIPNQHSPATEGGNPSVFFLMGHFLNLARRIGIDVDSHYFALQAGGYAILVLLIASTFLKRVYSVLPEEKRGASPLSWFKLLDRSLIENPRLAFYLLVSAILGMLICLPRMKSYAYFSVAALSALLVAELPLSGLALSAIVALALPYFDWSSRALAGFQQTIATLVVWAVAVYYLKDRMMLIGSAKNE